MQITVLGKSPAWSDAGGACSGYLVEDADTTLLLDCGNGVFAKLRAVRDFAEVDAVLISHLHADHILDLVPFAYGLRFSPSLHPHPTPYHPGSGHPTHPRLVAPGGAAETFRRVVGAWGDELLIEESFELAEYEVDSVVEVGPLTATFAAVPHYVPSHAINLRSANGGGRLTFSSDCRPSEDLVEAARDTDLLLVEATVPRPEGDGPRGHLTPAEAGEHARRAGAKRVVLTHISDEIDPDWAREEASSAFGRSVEIAREGAVYAL